MSTSDFSPDHRALPRIFANPKESQLAEITQLLFQSGSKQKLHSHEEVFKDHVSGQYDETIFRFRVPGGWIYTHTIVRFGSVDKNHVADTFVPDSTVDKDLPFHPTDDPRRDL
jgi:hypothetical protein